MKSLPPWNSSLTAVFIHLVINVLVQYNSKTFTVTSELAIFHACPDQDTLNGYARATSTILQCRT
jgi:hypothetical protein